MISESLRVLATPSAQNTSQARQGPAAPSPASWCCHAWACTTEGSVLSPGEAPSQPMLTGLGPLLLEVAYTFQQGHGSVC